MRPSSLLFDLICGKLLSTQCNIFSSHRQKRLCAFEREYLQPQPCGPIAAETNNPLQPQCIRTIFLARNMPYGTEPKTQRFLRVLKNRPRAHRCLRSTLSALVQTAFPLPKFSAAAMRTVKTIGPAKYKQILTACLFGAEPFLKFLQSSGIILHKEVYYML